MRVGYLVVNVNDGVVSRARHCELQVRVLRNTKTYIFYSRHAFRLISWDVYLREVALGEDG